MSTRAYYSATIESFLDASPDRVFGEMVRHETFALELAQRNAWLAQIDILRTSLGKYRGRGSLFFEYAIPRLGKRIDVLALIDHVIFVIEFKVGEDKFTSGAIDQVMDYALDLKNFHESSHDKLIAPVLVATRAKRPELSYEFTPHNDGLLLPILATPNLIEDAIDSVLSFCTGEAIDHATWESGRYCPTPTIIEAAIALYGGHSVADISRNDASAINLGKTSQAVEEIIRTSRQHSRKSICLITGVPGAGKTLVGLNIATKHIDKASELYSVFLSGNGPLVNILREALARDKVKRGTTDGRKISKKQARSEISAFVQNVHHFRDECLIDADRPPIEHVALFDEAQRAWNSDRTTQFMKQKKQYANFKQSEPGFLISCLDRHPDWAVIVCLVGGGQEINTGEAGIGEWIHSLNARYPEWHIHISPQLHDSEYGAGEVLTQLDGRSNVHLNKDLHLAVSMRSFRAESVAGLVKHLLDRNEKEARRFLAEVSPRYPIVLTRDLHRAKNWVRNKARGSERFGVVASSQAQRLKPYAIDIRSPMDPIHWFLGEKEDVRSSYYLEDVATEFHIQGLELDWTCVVWDGDFRYSHDDWKHFSFVGNRWNRIHKADRKSYLKNAYRVLLTRARQGMVIVVPEGCKADPTRDPSFYDPTFEYLNSLGFAMI